MDSSRSKTGDRKTNWKVTGAEVWVTYTEAIVEDVKEGDLRGKSERSW